MSKRELSERMRAQRAESFDSTTIGNTKFDQWTDEVVVLEQRAEGLEKNLILAAKTITGTSAGCWAPLRSRFCGEPVVGVVYSLPVCEFHLANRPARAAEEET